MNKKPNRLINEKSPYLLHHAYNPVDWYPWGEEAFEKARREDKPIFLSIGYASCHWCMVMERESFEDEEIARILNENFVPIKVDREERPDVDHIYMSACQAMTGHGGWPLSIFLTPDRKPFFAGTYFPKESRYGLPGFKELLLRIAELWQTNRSLLLDTADKVAQALQSLAASAPGTALTEHTLLEAYRALAARFDEAYGGFGEAPKFPTPHNIAFLLRWWKRTGEPHALAMVEKTLDAMSQGGIWDHIGFGFHRYSVDEGWLVPHFEKMLYDQALLAIAYIEAYQATGRERYAHIARRTFEYVLRDMRSPEGGFYSSESAESEGEEGRFYVWTPAEVKAILGRERGELFCRFYGVTEEGNFEGRRSVLHIAKPPEEFAKEERMNPEELIRILEESRRALFDARQKRPHPPKDDKILTDWNGLMIAALALGARALGEPQYAQAARDAADFVGQVAQVDNLRYLRHRYREGQAAIPGFLNDYAFFAWGLLELYETTFEPRYLKQAISLTRRMMELFWDDEEGGFFLTAEAGDLPTRGKDFYDGPIPSGNAVAALNLMRLAHIVGDPDFDRWGRRALESAAGFINRTPLGFTAHLAVLDFALGPVTEVVIAGELGDEKAARMLKAIWERFSPKTVVLLHPEGDQRIESLVPWVKGQGKLQGQATAYVCRDFSCTLPTTSLSELVEALE